MAILDTKCPFPVRNDGEGNFVEKSHNGNVAKCSPIALSYESKGEAGLNCAKVYTNIVPVAGPIPKMSFDNLIKLGMPIAKANLTLKRMAIAVIKGNSKILNATQSELRPDHLEETSEISSEDIEL